MILTTSTLVADSPPAISQRLQLDVPIEHVKPETPDSNNDPAVSVSAYADTSASPMKPSGVDVLIVDDEPDIRKMLRLLLQDEGYTVSDAADGVIGLARVRASSRPLVVLLDYKMPRMNGAELLEAVIADPELARRHAFIFLTANLPAFSPALHQMLTAAAIPVIQKPFQISDVLDGIEHAIARLRASPDQPAH